MTENKFDVAVAKCRQVRPCPKQEQALLSDLDLGSEDATSRKLA